MGWQRWTFLHSPGGSLALYIAGDHPSLVRTVTVAEPGMPAFRPADASAGASDRQTTAAGLLDRGKIDAALEVLQIGGPRAWQDGPETHRQMLRDNVWTLKGLISDPGSSWSAFTCADARRISVPVLLIGGEMSPAANAKALDALESCVNQSDRAVIAGVGHAMPRLNPSGFAEAVIRFIAQH